MSCKECEEAQKGTRAYYFRIGNHRIGYGSVGIIACEKHAKLVQEIFRAEANKLPDDGGWI